MALADASLSSLQSPFRGYLLASIGILLQALAGHWDVYSHRLTFLEEDPWWNPAHGALYTGIIVAALGVWYGWLRPSTRRASVGLGYQLILVGLGMELAAGAWNELIHRFIGTELRISPPHALFVVGMLLVGMGAVAGVSLRLSLERNMGTGRVGFTLLPLAASFLAVWLVAGGSTLYLAGVFEGVEVRAFLATLLGAITALILVTAARVADRPGFITALGLAFTAAQWFFLVVYMGRSHYLPLGFLGPLTAEGVYYLALRWVGPRISAALLGFIPSLLLYYTYQPFPSHLYGLQPIITPNPFLFSAMVGSLMGTGLAFLILKEITHPITPSFTPQIHRIP